jgi:hypothetical protein
MKASFTRAKKTTKRGEKHVKGSMQELLFPSFNCYLDGSDADIAILRRQEDDSFVAAFSARGVTDEGVIEAAEEDYRGLHIRDN